MGKEKTQLLYALNGAKDNPAMESFNGHFKTENRPFILDAQSLNELNNSVEARIECYDQKRLHFSR